MQSKFIVTFESLESRDLNQDLGAGVLTTKLFERAPNNCGFRPDFERCL